jgi:hypothetical protein
VNDKRRVKKPAFKYEDGSIYVGEWITGKRDGYGVLKDVDSTFYYGTSTYSSSFI